LIVSSDFEFLVAHWLNSDKEYIKLFEGKDEIVLSRQETRVILRVQLTPDQPTQTDLQSWLRIGAASLNHFQGVLSQAPTNGVLWLIQNDKVALGESHLLRSVESLLNQRDTWRDTAGRLKRSAPPFTPTSLRSLLY